MNSDQAKRIKIKASQSSIGLGIFLDGTQVGRIIGSRDPSGKNHSGYFVEMKNGKRYGYRGVEARSPGAYAYADDVKREIKGWMGKAIIEEFEGGK